MLRAWFEFVRSWIAAEPGLAAAMVMTLTAIGLAMGVLIAGIRDAEQARLLSEREVRALKRDQYRRECRARLVALQRRLGLRRSA